MLVHQLVSVNGSLGWILKLNSHWAKAKATSLQKDTNTLLRPNISEYHMKMNGPSPLRQSDHLLLMISHYLLSLATAQVQADTGCNWPHRQWFHLPQPASWPLCFPRGFCHSHKHYSWWETAPDSSAKIVHIHAIRWKCSAGALAFYALTYFSESGLISLKLLSGSLNRE